MLRRARTLVFPLLRLRDRDSSVSPPPPASVARAASFERAGKAVGEGGASGYSLHGCAKKRRRRPRLKRDGRSGERRRGERGDWPGHRGVAATEPWPGIRGRRRRGGSGRKDRDLRMGNEAAPGTGHRYTADGAALPARILPRPAPRGPNPEAGLHPCPRGSDPGFRSRGFRPLLPLTRGSSPAFLPTPGVLTHPSL